MMPPPKRSLDANERSTIKREEKVQQAPYAVIFLSDPPVIGGTAPPWLVLLTYGGRVMGSFFRSSVRRHDAVFVSFSCLVGLYLVLAVGCFSHDKVDNLCYAATLFLLCRVTGVTHLLFLTTCSSRDVFRRGTNCVRPDPLFFMSRAL